MKRLGKVWTALVYIFLYLPMIVLFIGSFNDGKDLSEFEGFTLDNYVSVFRDSHLLGLLANRRHPRRLRRRHRHGARHARGAGHTGPCAGGYAASSCRSPTSRW